MILIWKPTPYEVDIVYRGTSYRDMITKASREATTGVMSFGDVTMGTL